jgi:hypothetical protein
VSQEPIFYIPNGPPGEEYTVAGDQPPGVVLFFRLYAGILTILGASLVILGFAYIAGEFSHAATAMKARQNLVTAGFYVILGLVTCTVHAIAFFGGRRGWVHTLGLITLALASLSCCCLPFSLPLLLAWNKPEVKKWYTARPVLDDETPMIQGNGSTL